MENTLYKLDRIIKVSSDNDSDKFKSLKHFYGTRGYLTDKQIKWIEDVYDEWFSYEYDHQIGGYDI